MINCYTCRDLGEENGCSECGKKPIDETEIKEITPLDVSMKTLDNVWDLSKLKSLNPDKAQNERFLEYSKGLFKIFKYFRNGIRLPQSHIICSNPRLSKTILAKSCIQYSRQSGLKIPDIASYHTVRNELMTSKLDNILKEILFVKISVRYDKVELTNVVRDLLTTRGMMGLPTIILLDIPFNDAFMRVGRDILLRKDGYDCPFTYATLNEYFDDLVLVRGDFVGESTKDSIDIKSYEEVE